MKKPVSSKVKRAPVRKISDKKTDIAEVSYPKPFPIVAFGASAGGIKAFNAVLKHLDPDVDMAYVLIMHLSPNHKSALAEIVQSKTKMPVHLVEDGMALNANNVYVIPPNTCMSVVNGHLALGARDTSGIGNFPVDYFLKTLAAVYKNNAIGVILSGTASDGTLGLKAIKAEGGITFAQDDSAEFSGMPQSAVDSGYVDLKLSPEGIAKELKRLKNVAYTNLPSDKIGTATSVDHADALKNILTLVYNKFGVDFFLHYKQASILRRVMRRMALNQLEKLQDYAALLIKNPKEVAALFDDFLINVTYFFRDPDFYKTLSNTIFPAILKGRNANDPLRIWVAGCATGEEAYSIAISLIEYLNKNKLSVSFQIFASDLDGQAIKTARLGIFLQSALGGVSGDFLARYFEKADSQYQVVKSIRDKCVFAHHNLLKDPPFSRMDLISCQNVLIYLETIPQRKILQAFHYALKPSGYLCLAKSETTGTATNLFEPLDKKIRYYSRKFTLVPSLDFTLYPRATNFEGQMDSAGCHSVNTTKRDETGTANSMRELMLARFVYPAVVVNKEFIITEFFGETSRWLQPATGKASLNILKMVREDLLTELRALLQEARKTERTVAKEGVRVYDKEGVHELTLEAVPRKTSGTVFFLVVFREKLTTPTESDANGQKSASGKSTTVARLEAELVQSLETIKTTTEEYETTYEELQANNEEILSANEELQSVNEELETSKEELQSSNEELTSINDELNRRNHELKEWQEYTEAIVETMHGPLLVLNANLQVHRANKAFYETFQLSPEKTVGNFLYHLGDDAWNIPELRQHLEDQKSMAGDNSIFTSFELNSFFTGSGEHDLTVNVYRLVRRDNPKETLILLAFDDFTRRYNAEKSLLKTQEQLKLSLIGDAIGTWGWNLKTDEMKWSKENEHLNGLKEGSFKGSFNEWEGLVHPEDMVIVRKTIEECLKESNVHRSPLELEYRVTWPDKSVHWLLSRGHVYVDSNHKPERMVGVCMDITERKLTSENLEHKVKSRTIQLTRANNALVMAVQQLEQFVFISNHDLHEPLRKIQTFTNFLATEESNQSPNLKKYLDKIDASASRMVMLLNDLQTFSALKDDPSKFAAVDMNAVIKDVIKGCEEKIERSQATFSVSSIPEIYGDKVQMHQLFTHIVSNALKFNKGNPVIEITAAIATEDDYALHPELRKKTAYVSIEVKDNGIGFDQKYAPKLFILFQQLKDMHARGTGIGLAISKRIADNHRGFIFAKGKVNDGATFTVFLQAEKPETK